MPSARRFRIARRIFVSFPAFSRASEWTGKGRTAPRNRMTRTMYRIMAAFSHKPVRINILTPELVVPLTGCPVNRPNLGH